MKDNINFKALKYALRDVGEKSIQYEKEHIQFTKNDPLSLTSYFNNQYKKYCEEFNDEI